MGKSQTPTRVPWSRDELLVAFRLYCRTAFGKLHQHNPEIIDLARRLGRTPSAVGMKACNFASLDPVQRARNITALGNVGRADRELWGAFLENPEAVAAEAEAAYARLTGHDAPPLETELDLPEGPTETVRTIRARRVQPYRRNTPVPRAPLARPLRRVPNDANRHFSPLCEHYNLHGRVAVDDVK